MVSVLIARFAGVEGGIDGWQDAGVEGLGAVQQSQVFRRREVIVRADLRIFAIARTLEPSIVLTSCAGGDCRDGDELISIQRRCDHSAVAECLRSECRADRRIETLQKSLGGIHEDIVERGRGSDLGQLNVVWLDAIDGGGGVDVVLAEPGGGGEDFAVSQVCEFGGRICFGCAVSVTGENVETEDCLCRLGEWEEEGKGDESVGEHIVGLSIEAVTDGRKEQEEEDETIEKRKKRTVGEEDINADGFIYKYTYQ